MSKKTYLQAINEAIGALVADDDARRRIENGNVAFATHLFTQRLCDIHGIQILLVPQNHHDTRVLDELRRVDRRRDRGLRRRFAELAENAVFEVGEAGALAGAPAGPRHGDAQRAQFAGLFGRQPAE